MGCDCLCVVVSITVLALSGTLLGYGIADLTGEDAAQLPQLDGGKFQLTAIWTIAFGASGLTLWMLVICGVQIRSWMLLLVGVLLLAGMFVAVRLDDIANLASGGNLDYIFTAMTGGDLDDIVGAMNTSLSVYRDEPAVKAAWDFVQRKMHCCGVNSSSDWAILFDEGQVPDSCCRELDGLAATNCTATHGAYEQGCAMKVQNFDGDHRSWSVAVATAAASLILLLLICGLTCCTGGSDSSEYSPMSSAISRSVQAALNNRANQLNPNNWRYQGLP